MITSGDLALAWLAIVGAAAFIAGIVMATAMVYAVFGIPWAIVIVALFAGTAAVVVILATGD